MIFIDINRHAIPLFHYLASIIYTCIFVSVSSTCFSQVPSPSDAYKLRVSSQTLTHDKNESLIRYTIKDISPLFINEQIASDYSSKGYLSFAAARQVSQIFDASSPVVWGANSNSAIFMENISIDTLQDMAFSSDGSKLAVCSLDGTLAVYSLDENVRLFHINGNDQFRKLTWVMDDTCIVTTENDGDVLLWKIDQNTSSGSLLIRDKHHITRLCSWQKSSKVAMALSDASIVIIDIEDEKNIRLPSTKYGRVMDIQFLPNGKEILASYLNEDALVLWDISGQKMLMKNTSQTVSPFLSGKMHHITSIDISHDGNLALLAKADGLLLLWDIKKWEQVKSIPMQIDFLALNAYFGLDDHSAIALGLPFDENEMEDALFDADIFTWSWAIDKTGTE